MKRVGKTDDLMALVTTCDWNIFSCGWSLATAGEQGRLQKLNISHNRLRVVKLSSRVGKHPSKGLKGPRRSSLTKDHVESKASNILRMFGILLQLLEWSMACGCDFPLRLGSPENVTQVGGARAILERFLEMLACTGCFEVVSTLGPGTPGLLFHISNGFPNGLSIKNPILKDSSTVPFFCIFLKLRAQLFWVVSLPGETPLDAQRPHGGLTPSCRLRSGGQLRISCQKRRFRTQKLRPPKGTTLFFFTCLSQCYVFVFKSFWGDFSFLFWRSTRLPGTKHGFVLDGTTARGPSRAAGGWAGARWIWFSKRMAIQAEILRPMCVQACVFAFFCIGFRILFLVDIEFSGWFPPPAGRCSASEVSGVEFMAASLEVMERVGRQPWAILVSPNWQKMGYPTRMIQNDSKKSCRKGFKGLFGSLWVTSSLKALVQRLIFLQMMLRAGWRSTMRRTPVRRSSSVTGAGNLLEISLWENQMWRWVSRERKPSKKEKETLCSELWKSCPEVGINYSLLHGSCFGKSCLFMECKLTQHFR